MPRGIHITGIKADGSFSYQVVADTSAIEPKWEPPPMLNFGDNTQWQEREAFAQNEIQRILFSDWESLAEYDRDNKAQIKKLMEAWIPQLETQIKNLQQQLDKTVRDQDMSAMKVLIQKMQQTPDSVTEAEDNMLEILRKKRGTLTGEEEAKRAQFLSPFIAQASAPILQQMQSIQEKIANVKSQVDAIPPEPPRDPLAKMRIEIDGLHDNGKPIYRMYNGKDQIPPPPLQINNNTAWDEREKLAGQLIARSPTAQQKIHELQSARQQKIEQSKVKAPLSNSDRDFQELRKLANIGFENLDEKQDVIADILQAKMNKKATVEDLALLVLHYKIMDRTASPNDKAEYNKALDKRIYAEEPSIEQQQHAKRPKQVAPIQVSAQYQQIEPSEWQARSKLEKIDISALYQKERGQTGKGFFKALTMKSSSRTEQAKALQNACDTFVKASQSTLYTPEAVVAARDLFETLEKIKGSIEGEKKRLGASGMSKVCSDLEESLKGIKKDLERPEIKSLASPPKPEQETVKSSIKINKS